MVGSKVFALVALSALVALAGCMDTGTPPGNSGWSRPIASVDPALAGPLTFEVLDYDFGPRAFMDYNDRPFPLNVRGSIHVPEGAGPFPVVVHVHGLFASCKIHPLPGEELPWQNALPAGTNSCPDVDGVVERIESFRGYDYISSPLATHGYVSISIDSDEVNEVYWNCPSDPAQGDCDQSVSEMDWLRAQLILQTLRFFKEANEGTGAMSFLKGKLDLANIGLTGHSRGGPAISWAHELNRQDSMSAFGIKAVLGIGSGSHDHPVVGAAYGAIAEYCAGFNPAGAPATFDLMRFLGDGQPKFQWVVTGANHDFHNSRWAWIDDGRRGDSHCTGFAPEGKRLTIEQQQTLSGSLMGAFFRAFLGNETTFLPLLSGEERLAASMCPPLPYNCDEALRVSVHPARARIIEDTLDDGALRDNDLGGRSEFTGFEETRLCLPADCPGPTPHGTAPRLLLSWNDKAEWRLTVPESSQDWSGYDWLSLRATMSDGEANEGRDALDFEIVLEDTNGASETVLISDYASLARQPGEQNARGILNEVRIPLNAFDRLNLEEIDSVTLLFSGRGEIMATDVLLGA